MSSERNTTGSSASKVWKPPQKKDSEDGGAASIPSLFAAASLMTTPKKSTPYRHGSGSGRAGAGIRNIGSSSTSSEAAAAAAAPPVSETTSSKSNATVPPTKEKVSATAASLSNSKSDTKNPVKPISMSSKSDTSSIMKKTSNEVEAAAAAATTTKTATTTKPTSTPTATPSIAKSISRGPEKAHVGLHAGAGATVANSTGIRDSDGKKSSSKTTTTTTTNLSPRRSGTASPHKVVSPYSKPQRQSAKKKHWLEKEEEEEAEADNVLSSPSTRSVKNSTSPIMSPEDQSKFVKENWHILKSLMKEEPAPTPLIDLEDSKKAMWKLREAQWDNESASSEAERLEIEERARRGRQAADEEEIQAKIKDLYGTTDLDEVLISDKDDVGKYNLYSDSDDDSVE